MKLRIVNIIKIYFILLLIFICYYYISKYTNFYIPCIFNLITGYKCPGCGITHLLFSLLELNISAAFNANPLVFIYLPFIIIYIIYESYLYIFDKKDNFIKTIPDWFFILIVIITLIYGIVRNFY